MITTSKNSGHLAKGRLSSRQGLLNPRSMSQGGLLSPQLGASSGNFASIMEEREDREEGSKSNSSSNLQNSQISKTEPTKINRSQSEVFQRLQQDPISTTFEASQPGSRTLRPLSSQGCFKQFFVIQPAAEAALKFSGGPKTNPSRIKLLLFFITQTVLYLCNVMPWLFKANRVLPADQKGEEEVSFFGFVILHTCLYLIQAVNIWQWVKRTEFTRNSHSLHFFFTLAILMLQMPISSTASERFSHFVVFSSCALMALMTVFATHMALSNAWVLGAILVGTLIQYVSLVIQVGQYLSPGLILIGLIIQMTPLVFAVSLCVLQIDRDGSINLLQQGECLFKTRGEDLEKKDSKTQSPQQIASAPPEQPAKPVDNSEQTQQLQAVLEQLPSGVAITADWYDPSGKDTDEEISQSMGMVGSPRSSQHSSMRFPQRMSRSTSRKALEIKDDILKANRLIYAYFGLTPENEQTFMGPSQKGASKKNFNPNIFVRRCLIPLEQAEQQEQQAKPKPADQGDQKQQDVQSSLSGKRRRKKKMISLRSLARKNISFTGNFKIVPIGFGTLIKGGASEHSAISGFNQQNVVVNVHMRRVKTDGIYQQIFVLNDVSRIIKHEKNKLKNNFSHQLTASLCHEIMTPLNCIVNVADLILLDTLQAQAKLRKRSSSAPPDRRKKEEVNKHVNFLQTMQSSAKFMKLMLASQITSIKHNLGQLMLNSDQLESSLRDFLRNFLSAYRLQVVSKKIHVTLRFNNSIPNQLYLDWSVYQQILFHIMQNAFKFSANGGTIIISVTFCELVFERRDVSVDEYGQEDIMSDGSLPLSSDGNQNENQKPDQHQPKPTRRLSYLLTQVEDNGRGISDRNFETLFSTFNMEDVSFFTTQGIGIGLSTAKMLAMALQGGIHLNSRTGEGTKVGFSVQTEPFSDRYLSKAAKKSYKNFLDEFELVGINNKVTKIGSDLPAHEATDLVQIADLETTKKQFLEGASVRDFDLFFAGPLESELYLLHLNEQFLNLRRRSSVLPDQSLFQIKENGSDLLEQANLQEKRAKKKSKRRPKHKASQQVVAQVMEHSPDQKIQSSDKSRIKVPWFDQSEASVFSSGVSSSVISSPADSHRHENENEIDQVDERLLQSDREHNIEQVMPLEPPQSMEVENKMESSDFSQLCLDDEVKLEQIKIEDREALLPQIGMHAKAGRSNPDPNHQFGAISPFRTSQKQLSGQLDNTLSILEQTRSVIEKVKMIGSVVQMGKARDLSEEDQIKHQEMRVQLMGPQAIRKISSDKGSLLSTPKFNKKNQQKEIVLEDVEQQDQCNDMSVEKSGEDAQLLPVVSFMDNEPKDSNQLKIEEEKQPIKAEDILEEQSDISSVSFCIDDKEKEREREKIKIGQDQDAALNAGQELLILSPDDDSMAGFDESQRVPSAPSVNAESISDKDLRNESDNDSHRQRQQRAPLLSESDIDEDNDDDYGNESEKGECCSKATVLLVDDLPFNLMPLRAIIENQFKLKCDEASNGLIAVDLYYRNMAKTCCEVRYSVIFSDIQMPEMDGVMMAQQICTHEQILLVRDPDLPRVLIVMVSAYDSVAVIERVRAIGLQHFIAKPVQTQNVYPILVQVFGDIFGDLAELYHMEEESSNEEQRDGDEQNDSLASMASQQIQLQQETPLLQLQPEESIKLIKPDQAAPDIQASPNQEVQNEQVLQAQLDQEPPEQEADFSFQGDQN